LPPNQTAVKNGDEIKVSGTITQAAEDLVPNTLSVVLDPDVGDNIPVTVTTTKNSDGTTSFSGSVKPEFVKPGANGAGGATNFVASAQVKDVAGNIGGGVSGAQVIDNILPSLLNPGRTETTRTIRITFIDNLTSAVVGGCDENAYLLDGTPGLVEEVRFQGESVSCEGKPSDGSGTRILVLRRAQDVDATPNVTYNGTNTDPAVDGALNKAALQTIQTVVGIAPAAPIITKVTRNNGSETAFSEGTDVKTYFTRFRGTGDNATQDLQVSFNGARNSYTVEVLNGNGTVIASEKLSNPAIISPDKEFNATVRIPIGTTDGTFARAIRLVGNNLIGEKTVFNVTLDTVIPQIGSATKVDANNVTVSLSEQLAAGTDFANDWFAYETTTSGKRFYQAETVTSTNASTRSISFPFQNKGPFGGVDYLFTSPDGKRYEDRAGNQLADTIK
ncbi:MAG: hypothetical protein M3O86_04415, partial [Actinomycetota bacterium]|nr:hypothetical protein [Actinomycetota bacterium]